MSPYDENWLLPAAPRDLAREMPACAFVHHVLWQTLERVCDRRDAEHRHAELGNPRA